MKRTICLLFILSVALTKNVALGDNDKAQRVPAGAVAFHFVARISFFGPMDPPELVGYIAFIENIPGPFFSGPPGEEGEKTAFFTLRFTSGPPPIQLNPGSDVSVSLLPPGGRFDVYFDENPNQEWNMLDTFSDGKLIATFEESALLSTGVGQPFISGAFYNLFSSKLVFSKRFRFNGKRVDFKKLVPNGVTTNNFGSVTPVPDGVTVATQAFSGSAVAIGEGRGRRHDDDDDD